MRKGQQNLSPGAFPLGWPGSGLAQLASETRALAKGLHPAHAERPPSPCLDVWLVREDIYLSIQRRERMSKRSPTWTFFIAADPQAVSANAIGEKSTGHGSFCKHRYMDSLDALHRYHPPPQREGSGRGKELVLEGLHEVKGVQDRALATEEP